MYLSFLLSISLDLTFRGVKWTPVNAGCNTTLDYLNIDASPKMVPEPFTKRIKFWDSLNLINA